MTLRNPKDFAAGLLFVLFGLGFAFGVRFYTAGTPARIGPGFFPLILGGALAVLGLFVMWRGIATDGERIAFARPRALIVLALSLALFALVLKPFGLVTSTAMLAFGSSFAADEVRVWSALGLAAVLSIIAAAVFIGILGMNLPLWPVWFA
jgi:phosphate/sulfate permease